MVRRMGLTMAAMAVAAMMPALASAQQAARGNDDPCRDRDWGDRAGYCEVREMTMVPPGAPLTVNARPNGSITIVGWDGQEIHIRATVTAQADTEDQARAIGKSVQVRAVSDQISADGPDRKDGQQWAVSYTVSVPFDQALSLTSVNGSIRLTGMRAGVAFDTRNGSVDLRKVNGKIQGRTENGSVRVALDGERWVGEGLDVQTQNGSISLTVPPAFAAHIEASTTNGRVRVNLDNAVVGEMTRRHIVADVNGGGTPVKLRTTNGSVVVGKPAEEER